MPEVNGVPCWVWDRLNSLGWEDDELLCMALRWMGSKGILEEWVAQLEVKSEEYWDEQRRAAEKFGTGG